MKTKTTLRASLLLAVLFIAACGNKGDLFLPEQPTQEPVKSAQQDPIKQEKK